MQCNICELSCDIHGNSFGCCGMYALKHGRIVPRHSAQISSFQVSYIEDIPLFHYYPGSRTLCVGTVGCNFDCAYCINNFVACRKPEQTFQYQLSPQDLVAKAEDAGCRNVAFTVNEPAVSFPYFLEFAQLARKAKLKVGCATNAYFTSEAADKLARQIDFANISLKSFSDRFYRDVCRVPGVRPVLRNIQFLYEHGVHLEITTPVGSDALMADSLAIARFLGQISRDIPWHIFRLLPEYKLTTEEPTEIAMLKTVREAATPYLNYIYVGNWVGSQWQDTACPHCGTTLIHRINTSGCGAKLQSLQLHNGSCPQCAASISVVGSGTVPFENRKRICSDDRELLAEPPPPVLGLLDTGGHQMRFDFATGVPVSTDSKTVAAVASILARRPYPGDAQPVSDTWVTDMALELLAVYRADFVVLDYVQAAFAATNEPGDPRAAFEHVFSQVDRFLAETDFEPVIWGCGELEEVRELVDVEKLLPAGEAMAVPGGKYVDLNFGHALESVPPALDPLCRYGKVLTRQQFLETLNEGFSEEFAESIGDAIAIANPGWMYKGLGSGSRPIYRTGALCPTVPLYSSIGPAASICEVPNVIRQAVRANRKVALIMLEGVGHDSFPWPAQACRNHSGELVFQAPWYQYLTLSTGIPYNRYRHPLSNQYWLQDYHPYPYSGRFHRLLEDAICCDLSGKRSLAVGNRSIFTHAVFGADLAVECYCCNMRNYGAMAVIKGSAFGTEKLF